MESSLAWTDFYQNYFDAEKCLAEYFKPESEFASDSVAQPMSRISNFFAAGSLKGNILVVYGAVINLHLLHPACEHFKEIILMDVLETNLQYVKKWKNNYLQSFNWNHCIKNVQQSEEREPWTEIEKKLKESITQIEKVDYDESGQEVLKIFPQADCVLSPYHLTMLCKDHDSFISSVKNMYSLLNVGGHLIISVFIQCTYWYIDTRKFPVLCIEEDFVRKVLGEEGFVIKEAVTNQRSCHTTFSVMDYASILFILAQKIDNVQ
ncbi:nicotinamide N-methyltransferase-like [Lissotriton helveticus]